MPLFIRLIRDHVTHPDTSLSSVNEHCQQLLYIFDCNNRDANRAFVIFRENTAPVKTTGLGLLNASHRPSAMKMI